VPREEQAHARRIDPTRHAVRQDPPVVELRAAGVCAVLAALLLDDGGYLARSWGWSGAVAAAAAALGIAWLRRTPRGPFELVLVGGLAALALWALLSAWWSQSPPSSVAEAQRALVPLAAALAALVLFRRREAGWLAAAVLGAISIVSVANLLHRARGYSEVSGVAAEPIGYDNALGLLSALGVLVAFDAVGRRGWWSIAAATLPLNALVLVLAESTGAYLALAAGLAFAAVAAGGRLRAAGVAAALALGAVAVLAAEGHERERYWPVALDAAREHPVAGAGAGTFWQLWLEEREVGLDARDAHGLYVETLGELGAVGLALLLVALAAPVVAALRAPRRPLLAGAYGAFLVHAGIDWDWELAGVAVAGVLIGCTLLLDARREGEEREIPPRLVALWAAGGALLFLAAAVTFPGATVLDRALAAEQEGRPVDALHEAERAATLQPWASEPWLVVARTRRAGGRGDPASAAREGLQRDAHDWRLWLELAQSTTGEERERALERARSLNPLGPIEPRP
jgi:O-antigen ligase